MLRPLEKFRIELQNHCYKMTGSLSEAEDTVQETFTRALVADAFENEEHQRAWLWKTATRIIIDTSRRCKTRQNYVGTWLPEPKETPNPEKDLIEMETLTMGFLLTLEKLNERERAVLLLRDAAGFSSSETANILDLNDANTRKILSRARKKMTGNNEAMPSIRYERDVLRGKVVELIAAMSVGNANLISTLVSDDLVFRTDSGGHYISIRRPIYGVEKVQRLFLSLAKKKSKIISLRMLNLNAWPALAYEIEPLTEGIAPRGVFLFSLNSEGEIGAVFQYLNPEKIEHLF